MWVYNEIIPFTYTQSVLNNFIEGGYLSKYLKIKGIK